MHGSEQLKVCRQMRHNVGIVLCGTVVSMINRKYCERCVSVPLTPMVEQFRKFASNQIW